MAEMRDKFYKTIAERLRSYMERESITTSQLATSVDEQFNTIKGILEGRRFQAHHTLWLSEIIDIQVEKENNGDEENRLEDFI